jgi:predicted TIM-barrel fold metal-dependent hydrolase
MDITRRQLLAALLLGQIAAREAMPSPGDRPGSIPASPRIDAHTHVFGSKPAFYELLKRLNMYLLTICVVDKHKRGREDVMQEHAIAQEVSRDSRGRVAWCSTFDPEGFELPGFADRAIAALDQTFRDGAIATKIYKSIGMELKSRMGNYVLPDDPVFDPIFSALEDRNKTLYAHLAEPDAAWLPLDPSSPHYSYYKANPDWHMFLHPERPSKKAILAARDRVLKRHPKLRVVGCHLGSMERDVDDIAQRFDLYSNFVIDTASRVPDLMLQPRSKVRSFLIKYQDRVLYGTDLGLAPEEITADAVIRWEAEYARDWKFLATGEIVPYEGGRAQGLNLPGPVLRKLYYENAVKWVPGIAS